MVEKIRKQKTSFKTLMLKIHPDAEIFSITSDPYYGYAIRSSIDTKTIYTTSDETFTRYGAWENAWLRSRMQKDGVTKYVNMYKQGWWSAHDTRKEADAANMNSPWRQDRIACKQIVLSDGDWDE